MVMPEMDVLVVHALHDQTYEIAFPGSHTTLKHLSGSSPFKICHRHNRSVINVNITEGDHTVIRVDSGRSSMLLHILDTAVADYMWEAVLPGKGPLGAHHSIGSNDTVAVFGP